SRLERQALASRRRARRSHPGQDIVAAMGPPRSGKPRRRLFSARQARLRQGFPGLICVRVEKALPRLATGKRPGLPEGGGFYSAACTLMLLSASMLSFLSVASSSLRFLARTEAQSARPSRFAQAISVP